MGGKILRTGAEDAPVFMRASPEQEERFGNACREALDRDTGGIGTLNEKTLHAALKLYYDCRREDHEVRLGDHVADIVGEDGITEIQTRALYRLDKKLARFLEASRVTVVYPLEGERRIVWVEPGTGEVTEERRSPRRTGIMDGLAQLYGIRDRLGDPGLIIRMPLLRVRQIRYLDGFGKDRKKRSTKGDIIPFGLIGEAVIQGRDDYKRLLAPMEGQFTAGELGKRERVSPDKARKGLRVLCLMGAAEIAGKRGRENLYRFTD